MKRFGFLDRATECFKKVGMHAITLAIEAYVQTANSEFTNPLAIFTIKIIKDDLFDSYNGHTQKKNNSFTYAI